MIDERDVSAKLDLSLSLQREGFRLMEQLAAALTNLAENQGNLARALIVYVEKT